MHIYLAKSSRFESTDFASVMIDDVGCSRRHQCPQCEYEKLSCVSEQTILYIHDMFVTKIAFSKTHSFKPTSSYFHNLTSSTTSPLQFSPEGPNYESLKVDRFVHRLFFLFRGKNLVTETIQYTHLCNKYSEFNTNTKIHYVLSIMCLQMAWHQMGCQCIGSHKVTNSPLRWRHNERDGVSNHQPHDCLLNRLFGHRSKETSKLSVTGLCAGNSPGPVNSPHKGPVTRKMFPFDDVIMLVNYPSSKAHFRLKWRQPRGCRWHP